MLPTNAVRQNQQQGLVMLSLLRDRYDQLTPREKVVYDVVLSLVEQIPKSGVDNLIATVNKAATSPTGGGGTSSTNAQVNAETTTNHDQHPPPPHEEMTEENQQQHEDCSNVNRLLDYIRSGSSEEMRSYIKYGQALLAVYRLVKRGIVPDPQIVEYLKDNLNPDLAKTLAINQNSRISSPTSTSSHLGHNLPINSWSRASLAQKIMRDTSNKYNRLVSTNNNILSNGQLNGNGVSSSPSNLMMGGSNQQINFAMRLENLRVLQTILAKKFLKHSLRSPEQIYNFIISNDTVGTLSSIASGMIQATTKTTSANTTTTTSIITSSSSSAHSDMMNVLNNFFKDRKEDVLVKLSTLMSEPCCRLMKDGQLVMPASTSTTSFGGFGKGQQDVPIYNALAHFRRHKFPAGCLRLAKTICLKDDINENGRLWIEHRISKRHNYHAVAKQASTRISNRELKRQQEIEREQRERMKALRERNMDAYMALVKNVKNQRIQEILENTEKLLSDIGAKIQVERNQNEERRKQDALKAQERLAKRKRKVVAASAASAADAATTAPLPPEEDDPTTTTSTSLPAGQPKCLIGGKLMAYQLAGLDFLMSLYNNHLSGILADEMGLGKTIQTISLIAYLYEMKNNPGPHLIAVPLSTLPNWSNEFEKWCPSLKVLQYRGNKIDRRDLNFEVKRCRYNVLLTTFEYILRERKILGSIKWKFIIVDEGHKMKNVKSKFHSTLGEFKSTHRLLLTGTPLQNNLNELWSLLNFLMPHTFSSGEDFERWFEEPFREQFGGTPTSGGGTTTTAGGGVTALTEEEKLIVINRLHLVLRPFLLRRVKADVLHDLPSKREYVIRVPLSSWQKLLYRQILNKSLKVKDSSSGKITQKSISNTIMQLRKAVNHPYLFLDMYNIDDNLYKVSGKFEILDRILTKLLKFNHKILIFSQMTSLMDILADYFDFRGLKYYRLDGSIMLNERQDIMAKFNQGGAGGGGASGGGGTSGGGTSGGSGVGASGGGGSEVSGSGVDPTTTTTTTPPPSGDDVNIFMLSTRAGGLGLNLQSGDTVILFDSDWNPHADLQAQARVHRVGQKREVLVLRFITDSPVEEMILAKAQYKLSIDQQIIQAGMFSNQFNEDEREQNLRQLLSQKDTHGSTTLTTPPQLVKYLARSDQELITFANMDRELFGNEIYDQWPNDDNEDQEGEGDSSRVEEDEAAASREGGGGDASSSNITPTSPRGRRYQKDHPPQGGRGDYRGGTTSNSKEDHQEQIRRDNDLVRELLEKAGRLCTEENIPQDVKEINASDHEDDQKNLFQDNTRGVRKSRLRAQHLIKDEQELFNDIDRSLEEEVAENDGDAGDEDDDDDVIASSEDEAAGGGDEDEEQQQQPHGFKGEDFPPDEGGDLKSNTPPAIKGESSPLGKNQSSDQLSRTRSSRTRRQESQQQQQSASQKTSSVGGGKRRGDHQASSSNAGSRSIKKRKLA